MKQIFVSSLVTFAVAMGLLKLGEGNTRLQDVIGKVFWPVLALVVFAAGRF
jgi:hypothetical protein